MRRKHSIIGLCSLLLISACGGGGPSTPAPVAPQPPPPTTGLTERPSLANLSLPEPADAADSVALTVRYRSLGFDQAILTRPVPNSNTMLVAQQSGLLSIFNDSSVVAISTVVLDISAQVRNEGEQGLLGVTFDPGFQTNGHLFLHYTPQADPRRTRISRFTWSNTNNPIDPTTELMILEQDQPFSNHNGGSIEFGPDGFLYIALGDGGSGGDPQNNAQNTENLLGAILRIDVAGASTTDPYRIPDDNPWANSSPDRGELWAIGLRNPFRMSFDSVGGELWAGDVGQADREEINIIDRGQNYGWRVREGTLPFDDTDNSLPLSAFTDPIIDLQRADARSITGGAVYRGNSFPAVNGQYIYGDFATENIWSLQRNPAAAPTNTLLGSVPAPAHFGPDTDGELVITSYSSGFYGLRAATGSTPIATELSATGVFTDLASLTPASGLIEYAVTEPYWADGAQGPRWLGIPDADAIGFNTDAGAWEFPLGSVLVQQINIDTTDRGLIRLETRVLLNRVDGWQGFTYVWNDEQTDAELLTNGTDIALTVADSGGNATPLRYRVPSQGECVACHNDAARFVLGAATRQFNRDFDYPSETANQVAAFNGVDLFTTDVLATTSTDQLPAHTASAGITTASAATDVEAAARSYLDVNCASCHRPDGPTGSNLDLRASQSLAELNALDVTPSAGDLGIANGRIIAPGDPAASLLLERMRRLDGNRMPPVASRRIDDSGVTLIQRWIESL